MTCSGGTEVLRYAGTEEYLDDVSTGKFFRSKCFLCFIDALGIFMVDAYLS